MNPAATAHPAIDPATLARLHDLDPSGQAGIVGRVLRTYETALANALPAVVAATGAADAAELRRLSHTLKSSSASVGALALSALCSEAERIARDGWSEALPPLSQRLVAEGERVQAALGTLLAGAV